MAALTLNKPVKSAAKGRIKLPVKHSINLAGAGEKPLNMKIGVPAIILILIAAVALGKFGVADRFAALSKANGEVSDLKFRLSETYAKIDQYSELEEKYAHYTYTGMTEEELSRVDRTETVKMIERVVLPSSSLAGWSITGNQLTITASAKTLQEINVIAQRLEEEEIVSYCQVTTAATDPKYEYYNSGNGRSTSSDNGEGSEEDEDALHGVTAQITAFLILPEEEG